MSHAITRDPHGTIADDTSGHAVRYAAVYLLDNPFCIDRTYDYYIPAASAGRVVRGGFVTVPFGQGNRRQLALVVAVSDHPTPAADPNKPLDPAKIKPIGSVCTERLFLTEEQLSLCFYLKEQTLCTVGEAVRTVVPAAALAKLTVLYGATPPAEGQEAALNRLTPEERAVYDHLAAHSPLSMEALKTRFGAATAKAALAKLTAKHLAAKDWKVNEPTPPTETHYALACDPLDAEAILRGDKGAVKLASDKHKAILSALLTHHREGITPLLSGKALMHQTGATRVQCRAMVIKGLVREEAAEALPDPLALFTSDTTIPPTAFVPTDEPPASDHPLSEEQAAAIATLESLVATEEAKAALLHGVTGSGKTRVMLEMIDRMLAAGKGVIVLLPEISLTPQMLSIFHRRYGERVAVIHSGLSAGERMASHTRIKRGDAPVVVGTRSAVFAPLPHLGMIVMDEEQEHTYKSDMNPKYHARDMARYRCAAANALLLLASATPSLESYQKAVDGKYTLIRLTKRFGGATLPTVTVADMRREPQSGNTAPLSTALTNELARVTEMGEQAVLFLNRRGYSSQVLCRSCGQAVLCPKCSVAMNYHVRRGTYEHGEMVCHWCGTRRPYPTTCPECGSAHLTRMGYGTQRIEQELEEVIPTATVMRMDADTTASKSAYHDLLGSFRRHEADVLLGTQMVTKGHDFPDVTLVGVLMADASLYLDDYRAAERTFSLLTQVIGRAGRGEKPGMAVIQTMNPDSDVIKLACAQDYDTFFAREIKLRRLLTFPPFCDIVLLTVTSTDEKELHKACLRLTEQVSALCESTFTDVPLVSFGPFEAPVYRVDNVYRMRIVIKCRLNRRARALFATLLTEFAPARTPNAPMLSVDFNPTNI